MLIETYSIDMQDVGNRIRSIVFASKFSPKEISIKLGISYQYLFKIFNSENVDTKYLFQLAEILNIPVTSFFSEGNSENVSELNEQIKNLKHKNYIIETIARDIQRMLINKASEDSLMLEKTTPETIAEKNIRDDKFEELLSAAVEAIVYFDKKPDTLTAYRTKMFEK